MSGEGRDIVHQADGRRKETVLVTRGFGLDDPQPLTSGHSYFGHFSLDWKGQLRRDNKC